jgi:hypothetical protein
VARTPKYELYGLCGAFIETPAGLNNTTLRMFTRYGEAISNRMVWVEKQTAELCEISPLLVLVAFKVAVAIQTRFPSQGPCSTLASVVQSTFNNKKP